MQGLSHQIQLFLVEYNKSNSGGGGGGGGSSSADRRINLPGYKPRRRPPQPDVSNEESTSLSSPPPEDILHQQRLLLQDCDRLKLCVSRHQSGAGQNMSDVVEVITRLGASFTRLIELMLSKEIKVRWPD